MCKSPNCLKCKYLHSDPCIVPRAIYERRKRTLNSEHEVQRRVQNKVRVLDADIITKLYSLKSEAKKTKNHIDSEWIRDVIEREYHIDASVSRCNSLHKRLEYEHEDVLKPAEFFYFFLTIFSLI